MVWGKKPEIQDTFHSSCHLCIKGVVVNIYILPEDELVANVWVKMRVKEAKLKI